MALLPNCKRSPQGGLNLAHRPTVGEKIKKHIPQGCLKLGASSPAHGGAAPQTGQKRRKKIMTSATSATGIVYDIKRFAIHDGPGIRTTIFFKGCPLNCWWCQNPESRAPQPEPRGNLRSAYPSDLLYREDGLIGKEVTVASIMKEVEKDVLFFDESGGGVTVSGGEPLLQIDFLHGLLQALKARDIHTVVDTTGYAGSDRLLRILPLVDLWLYDLKLMDDEVHRKHTGVSNRVIIKNLLLLHEENAPLLIRVPLIPGVTDTTENLTAIARFLASIDRSMPVELLPYNQFAESKYERLGLPVPGGRKQAQSADEIEQKKDIFRQYQLKVR